MWRARPLAETDAPRERPSQGSAIPIMSTKLKPIGPSEALELYLEDCSGSLSPNTIQQKRYQLGHFVEWCAGADNGDESRVENLNELSGRDLTRFKNWRSDGIGNVTLRTNLSALREFLRFCVTIDAVSPSLPEKLNVPDLGPDENVRESFLGAGDAEAILDHKSTFEYASLDHVLFLLQWNGGLRMSAIHSIDVDDVDFDDDQIEIRHRAEEGSRLKNGADGERIVTFDVETISTIEDYVEHIRPPVEDEYGREPLFPSTQGRLDKTNLNRRMYAATTPCQFGQECPAGKDPYDCEYTGAYQRLIKCPHNARPHDVRRGSITYWLRSDVPEKVVSDRMNVSLKTLDRHYDRRSDEEKADVRRQYLEDV